MKRLAVVALYFTITVLVCISTVTTKSAFATAARIIDDTDTVVLHGNMHQNARPEFDKGAVNPSHAIDNIILSLKISTNKQVELDQFHADQQNPTSPNFHRWLTPEAFGERFGPTHEDASTVINWLTSQGFVINDVAKGRTWINFSGKVSNVEKTFHTKIHYYDVNGESRQSNATDPAIPRGLSDLVEGPISLHNFPHHSMGRSIALDTGTQPLFTSGNDHYLTPGDFATIYNLAPLYNMGIDGTGQTIAITGRTHPANSSANWAAFRSKYGLPVNPPQIIINGPDPGDLGVNENSEADLDVEWSGAVAKNASIIFVTSKSTNSSDGVDLSAQYIVNKNLASVMSTSFGQCESKMGVLNSFYSNLWSQAAVQGITVFVSSGDSGAAVCDKASATTGTRLAVNGIASTPYNIAVGGTQFNEGSGSYWSPVNGTYYNSAISYIPEVAWNESGTVSGGAKLWSTSGGVSSIYSKPAWQVSPGVPNDGMRDLPDVSLAAASHDSYYTLINGQDHAVSGTSAASPAFAGIMALITQKTGQRQGNANPRLYQLGIAQYVSGGVSVFHDITSGNNSVPGVTGYSSGIGYDLATGLGSVDAFNLVSSWDASTNPITTYRINFIINGNGSLTGTTSQTIYYGASATQVTAVPATGNHFVNWTGTGGFITTSTNPLTVKNVTSDQTITANFAPNPINGVCGSSNGGTYNSAPSTNLCYSGNVSAVSNNGSFNWTCEGLYFGTTASCSAISDTTPPILNISSFVDGAFTNNPIFNITGTVNEQSAVSIFVNNNALQTVTSINGSFSVTVVLVEGINTIQVNATDLAGNISSVKRSITSDTSAPKMSITSPPFDISTTRSNITISGIVTDTVSSSTIVITVDNSTYSPVVGTGGSFNQAINLSSDKTYAIVVSATDQAGNKTAVKRNIIKNTSVILGDVNGDGIVDIKDALKVLQMAVGLVAPTGIDYATADVAPIINGKPLPDGIIDIADAVVILEKAVGIVSW